MVTAIATSLELEYDSFELGEEEPQAKRRGPARHRSSKARYHTQQRWRRRSTPASTARRGGGLRV